MTQTPRLFFAALALAGGLGSCGGQNKPVEQSAATPATASATSTSAAPATGAVFTLSIDGEAVPAHSYKLTSTPLPTGGSGFMFSIEAAQTHVGIFSLGSTPLSVGECDVIDTASSAGVMITSRLPPRFNQELKDSGDGFHTFLVDFKKNRTFMLYDWGAGPQALNGRKLGQMVFTRVSNGTADGSFQCYVYGVLPSEPKIIEWKGELRPRMKLRGHELRGTFKDLPIKDLAKTMNGLRAISEATKKLAPPAAKSPH